MKIAVIDTTIDGETIGGAQTFLPKLLAGLRERGNEVHLITKGIPNKKVRAKIEESKATLHCEIWNPNDFVETAAPVLAEWLNKLAPDIYLISVSADIGWAVLPMLDPQIATLTIGHTDSKTFYLPVAHYKNFLTGTIGVSPEICSNYVKTCVIDEENVEWIPYGTEISQTKPTAGTENFLQMIYVGRLEEEQKRISDLIKICKKLSEDKINYRFSIVGDGEEMPKIKEALTKEIAAGSVILHGWLKDEDVIGAMRKSDVFVLTSAYEGFCIALVESMANGCCPVVTDIRSGNKHLIKNGENGFILPIGDTNGFADILKFLNLNRTELLEFRKKAWETGKNYSSEKMVSTYQEYFLRVLTNSEKHSRRSDAEFPLMPSCRSKYPLWLRKLKARTKQLVSSI